MKSSRRYNHRQRKKLHIGEYQELAFEVMADVSESARQGDPEALLDRFLQGAIEANGLLMAGAIDDYQLSAYVLLNAARGSVSAEQREAVEKWLQASADFENVRVGPLRDAWYGVDQE
ncbi:YggL 50S ribosome-binding family protein [Cupriavidus cauae]|uniref:DUF469 family protein n=1 Tax=Cupriavidus cauae TaxID=2608999 RepID=A0A5M8B371_9BURK|nr:50S ribosome-binding protein YggL [Cupriavidus cauae]KAA6129669.1 DUF469 family protein [Cupriavidus cauae]